MTPALIAFGSVATILIAAGAAIPITNQILNTQAVEAGLTCAQAHISAKSGTYVTFDQIQRSLLHETEHNLKTLQGTFGEVQGRQVLLATMCREIR